MEKTTAEGSVVTINPLPSTVMDVTSNIVPLQSGTGDPSPDNVRPIVPWKEATISRRGENILETDGRIAYKYDIVPWEKCKLTEAYLLLGFAGTGYGFGYTITEFQEHQNQLSWVTKKEYYGVGFPIRCVPNTRYTQKANIHAEDGKGRTNFTFYAHDGTKISDSQAKTSAIAPPNAAIMVVGVSTGTVDVKVTVTDWAVSAENESIEYTPYAPDSTDYTVQFGRDVYGGQFNWNTGEGHINQIEIEATRENSGKGGTSLWYIVVPQLGVERGKIISTHYKGSSVGSLHENDCSIREKGNTIYVYDSRIKSAEDLYAFLEAQKASGTPVMVCYELAEPIPFSVTPTQITALSSHQTNTIWSDTGPTEISYYNAEHLTPEIVMTDKYHYSKIADVINQQLPKAKSMYPGEMEYFIREGIDKEILNYPI